ncbi:MAG TPA: DUF2182 domain-containing protein [Acetobacteraceae bacterium]|nr:DUF2182 domain-containing protein [Acetobacteraceae bacterium]
MNSRAAQVRAPLWAGLAVLVGLCWLWLQQMNAGMPEMAGDMPMAMPHRPLALEVLFATVMWSVMMVAMMVPTALRAIATFASLAARRDASRNVPAAVAVFVGGYGAAWMGYSVLAASLQVVLARTALLTPMLQSASVWLSAAILLAAGMFQFTALKDRCLAKCRTPLAFFLAEWRDGTSGALRLGLRHGGYCVVCCWALMAVLFVAGAMNLLWMAVLTLVLLVEKLAPPKWRISTLSGVALIGWGVWLIGAAV